MQRKAIRDQVRAIIKKSTSLNGFGPRDQTLALTDLPACVVHFPGEQVIADKGETIDREIELHIEPVIRPRKDPEVEIFSLADQIETAVIYDSELETLVQRVELDSAEFYFEREGDIPLAAARLVFRIRYQTERKDVPGKMPKELWTNGERID